MALAFSRLTIPSAAAINAVAGGRSIPAAGWRTLVPLTYGEDRVRGRVLNIARDASTATMLLVQVLWGHAINAADTLHLNDQALPGTATVATYTGAQSSPDGDLVAAFAAQGIAYADTLEGFAYSVVRLPVAIFDGRLDFTARVEGRRVYDPRKDSTAGGTGAHRLDDPGTWEYLSFNPSLALADWMSNALYGAGEPVQWASVGPAANANDAMIGSPSEPRRRLGLTLYEPTPMRDLAEALRAYAGCWLVPTADGVKLLPDADAAPDATYSHASGQIAALEPLQLRDMGNSPTAVEVIYTDTSQTPWRTQSFVEPLPGAGSTLPWRVSTVRLPGVQRATQACREARERLNKLNLCNLSTTVEVFDDGIARQRGDIVTLSHPVGLAAKPFRVTDVHMPGVGRWRLAVTEHDPAVYSDAVVTVPTYADTSLVIDGDGRVALAGSNLLNAANWVIGSSGSQLGPGPTQWFEHLHSAGGYNVCALSQGPDGAQRAVWYAVSGSAAGTDPEGGIGRTSQVSIDPDKPYRFSVWVYVTGPADGSVYLGCESNTVDDVPSGVINANPYFHALGRHLLTVNRWYLMTGHVLPAGYAGAQLHQSGVFDGTTGEKVLQGDDMRWHSSVSQTHLRAFQYYTGGAGRYLLLAMPRIDVLDGHEPSTAELLAPAVLAAMGVALGKGKVFIQSTPPTAEGIDDIWFDSDNDNSVYRWSGSAWMRVPLGTDALAPGATYAVLSDEDLYSSFSLGAGAGGSHSPTNLNWANTLGYAVDVEVNASASVTIVNTNGLGSTRVNLVALLGALIDTTPAYAGPVGEQYSERPLSDIPASGTGRYTYARKLTVTVPAGYELQMRIEANVTNLSGGACDITFRDSRLDMTILKR